MDDDPPAKAAAGADAHPAPSQPASVDRAERALPRRLPRDTAQVGDSALPADRGEQARDHAGDPAPRARAVQPRSRARSSRSTAPTSASAPPYIAAAAPSARARPPMPCGLQIG